MNSKSPSSSGSISPKSSCVVYTGLVIRFPFPTSSTAFSGRRILPERCLEMVNERGMEVDYITIPHWVQEYSLELNKRFMAHLRSSTNDSWWVDETYIAR
ncbi:IS6 family transposase [Chlorogloea sp. CCALA 695]|uniref:IS6 family transposase n=1 Tax=Chlorogloea sp. CCALA 695 TaxID=2107693 RepID=UPI0011B247FB|nr:IS6 family transposase [Chlorogloea sp. CCALA 695]